LSASNRVLIPRDQSKKISLPEDGDVGIAAAQKGFVDMGQTGEAERLPDDTGMEHFREV
jgi:hypothetical protein